jgi:hypothetical protein
MTTTDLKTYAIFDTSNGLTHMIQYVAEGDDEEEAFSVFDDDILSNTGEEAGWRWHVYQIPADIADDDDAIYDHVDGRSPHTITS